ncbi:MAG: acyltransferase [Mangrovicoccus sp.]|nr:acyltransferase [Mangrovicoccus sp.]
MIYLAERAQGRDNNLNLLRMIAAIAVIVSHAWTFAYGFGTLEPLEAWTGHSLGSLAVAVFFAISGFLITGSFHYSAARWRFVASRGLRIFPALLVNLIFVAAILAPLVTTLPWHDYFSMAEPYVFVLRNFTLYDLRFQLPGVFQDNPFPAVVGSIWTLYYELLCYGAVFALGLAGIWRHRALASACVIGFVGFWIGLMEWGPKLNFRDQAAWELALPFAYGAGFFIWRDRVPLSLGVGAALFALVPLAHDGPLYYPALSLAITYASFWLAYIPGGWLRRYNRLGDYSYGVYIYGFPMQGLVMWLFGPQTPLANILTALPPTLALAVLSWHLVEKPALALKPTV